MKRSHRHFPLSTGRLLVLCLAGGAQAQVSTAPVEEAPQLARGAAGLARDEGAGARSWTITPRIAVDEIWSDNARYSSTDKRSELTTQLSPGLRVAANGRHLTGFADYSLVRMFRANDAIGDETQHNLRSAAKLEAVENQLFVDYSGSIMQRAISAFGLQTPDASGFSANRTEVKTFQLAPYLVGRFGEWANYRLRYSLLRSRSNTPFGSGSNSTFGTSDQDGREYSGSLSSPKQGSLFNWALDASRQASDFKSGREVDADQLRGTLGYRVMPELNLTVLPGWESNNYASTDKESRLTWGVGADWASERTKASAKLEDRTFGRTYALNLEHRTQRTAWKFSDSKNANVTPTQLGSVQLGALYDLLFFQFESIEPDPVRRGLLVESFLQANGLNGATLVNAGFSSSGALLQRRQDVSFTLIGLRDTITLLGTRTNSSSLFNTTTGNGDLANSAFVRQQSYSLNYARRLSPDTSVNLLVSRLRSLGSQISQSTTLKTYNLSFTTQLGKKTSATIGLRRTEFDSPTSPYTENSIRGGVSVRF